MWTWWGQSIEQHAGQASLRYRYYVSQTLVIGRPRSDVASKRWRIPASELENAVLATLTSFLDDQSELTSMFQLGHMTPVEATAFLEAATSMSLALGKGIPLSTTHTITSAIVGAAASRRTSDVRWIVFKWIVLVWVITFQFAPWRRSSRHAW